MKTYLKYLLTGTVILIAVALVLFKYWAYVTNPWTRNGQVRAEVVQVTPRVSGPIVKLEVKDNQFVKAGDLLFEIDPRTFAVSLAQARAQYDQTGDNYLSQEKQVEAAAAQVEATRALVQQAKIAIKAYDATIAMDKAEYERQQEMLPHRATSQKAVEQAKASYEVSVQQRKGAVASLSQSRAELGQAIATLAEAKANLGALGDANASIREARANVRQAELNLEFTQVRAAVDGYVTNLNLRLGSQSVANQPALALIDINSFWIVGYFKETYMEDINIGDESLITMMAYPDKPIKGRVDSLGWGISLDDGSTGFELLPNVNPTFEWIRLAQRVPVRVHPTEIPEGVVLRVGMTASVLIRNSSRDEAGTKE